MRYEDMDKIRSGNLGKKSESANNFPRQLVKEEVLVNKETIPNNSLKTYGNVTVDKHSLPTMEFDTLQVFRQNLNNCLSIVDNEVMKGYLTVLSDLDVVPMQKEYEKILSDRPIQFFKITELVYQEDEFSIHKLSTIFNAMSKKPCMLALMIKSDGRSNEFYLGVRAIDSRNSTGTMMHMLQQDLIGLFPGSKVAPYYNEELKKDLEKLNISSMSSVSCVADFKQNENNILNDKGFVQGIEKFVDSMNGRKYTAVFLAENMSYAELMGIRREYENIYSQMSPFVNMQMNFSTSTNSGQSKGISEGISEGISRSYGKTDSFGSTSTHSDTKSESSTRSQSDSEGKNSSESDGVTDTKGQAHTVSESISKSKSNTYSVGLSANISQMVSAATTIAATAGVGFIVNAGASVAGTIGSAVSGGLGINAGYARTNTTTNTHGTSDTKSTSQSISKTLTHGISRSHTVGTSHGSSVSSSDSIGKNRGQSYSETIGHNTGKNITNTINASEMSGMGQSMTLNMCNMSYKSILNRLEKQLKRIEECESTGMWKFAGYFVGDGVAETESAANIYRAIVSGKDSGIECSATNTWNDKEKIKLLEPYFKNFVHPVLEYKGFDYDGPRSVNVTPAVMVSTDELAIHMGLPFHSVKGLPVVQHAPFEQEVVRYSSVDNEINLGKIYHMGYDTQSNVNLDLNSLSMHTFVTGSTGSGKSNVIYNILEKVKRKSIPFLVIEPAKGEYRRVFSGVKVYGTNPNMDELLVLNPFSFPQNIHVLEHIDRLVEIFNVCWPMYAAMPAVLKDAIESAYITAGWDLEASVNYEVEGLFPTFEDVLLALRKLMRSSDYSADTKGDYIGSLSTRLKSLTNGINGIIFGNDEISLNTIFNQNVIVDISRIGSMETKSLIMGMLVLKLQEYRLSCAGDINSPLKHVTVLEEAHNLLKRTSTEQSAESSNLTGKSVEMLANAIAEMRTYGEGFIIVDQAPAMLDTAAIRNTNTKIVMRLPEGNDRELLGESMALNEKQTMEISKLPTGVAAVYQNDWQGSVLCKIPKYIVKNTEIKASRNNHYITEKEKYNGLLHVLLKDDHTSGELNSIKEQIKNSTISAGVRKYLINNIKEKNVFFSIAMAGFLKRYKAYNEAFTDQFDCNDYENMLRNIIRNISPEFEDFTENELIKIIFYISCQYSGENVDRFKAYLKGVIE
jgi:hypothetical protein